MKKKKIIIFCLWKKSLVAFIFVYSDLFQHVICHFSAGNREVVRITSNEVTTK